MVRRPLSRPAFLAAVLAPVLFALLGGRPNSRVLYNSEEHRLIVDRGVAQVVIPDGVTLPAGLASVQAITGVAYANEIRDAKTLAHGSAKSQDSCFYSLQTGSQYLNMFGQGAYNDKIYVPDPSTAPTTVLRVHGYTSTSTAGGFTIGQLASLYGDYRRTTFCDGGKCYLTNADVGTIGFSTGSITIRKGTYCPDAMIAGQYLERIGSGLVPPFGSLGNATSNSAGPTEYDQAGWWGDEMIRIANSNDWHFSNGAVAWYVGLHRLALLYADSARSDSKHWVRALHYEANALHSLTDLFAFGHVVTHRDRTSYGVVVKSGSVLTPQYRWMEHVLTLGGATRTVGQLTLSTTLPAITNVQTGRSDLMLTYITDDPVKLLVPGYGPYVGARDLTLGILANNERTFHDDFNKSGATVRNLNGDEFFILGDGGLGKMLVTKTATDVIAAAVKASVQSLFDAHVQLRQGGSVSAIGAAGSPYFAALRYLPIYVTQDNKGYFKGRWTQYAQAVNGISGVNKALNRLDACQVPVLDGFAATPGRDQSACAAF